MSLLQPVTRFTLNPFHYPDIAMPDSIFPSISPVSHLFRRGRLAPSPTGLLHLGNAWAFLLAWLACRAEQGTLVLRMEDIDPSRSKPEFVQAIMDDLRWLGLDWDEGPEVSVSTPVPDSVSAPDTIPAPQRASQNLFGPYVQSQRTGLYEQALRRLSRAGRVYPCFCSRRELRELQSLAGAPHVGDEGAPYPGTCRRLTALEQAQKRAAGRAFCLRLHCPEQPFPPLHFVDAVCGPQQMSLQDCGGDFALRRSDGVWAYQLAVVVDDGLMGINQVVRGEDILASTPRQLLLFDWLGFARPEYAHVPLLRDAYGERLAKRHQSLTLNSLRQAGWTGADVVGLLAHYARLQEQPVPVAPQALISRFAFDCLPREPVCLSPELVQQAPRT